MDAPGLGHIVAGLLLGEVGNVPRHGGSDDEGSSTAFLEVVTDGLGAVKGSVEIGLDDLIPLLDGAIKDAGVCGAAGVGDEGVDLAELLDDVGDELFDTAVVADVALVGFGFDLVFLGKLLGIFLAAVGAGGVGDGDAVREEVLVGVRRR